MGMDANVKLCDQSRGTSCVIHVYPGNGYVEKVHENAFVFSSRV